MADKSINDLPKSASLTDDDSLPVYKSTEKKTERITVGQLKDVAKSAATGPAEEAANSADKAKVAAEIAKNAQQGAEKSLEQLNDQVELAQSAREGAENAKKSIEDMTVSAETLPPGFEATATKTIDENGVTNIKLGIPKGDTGEQGEPGVSPTVNVQKDGKITTIIITDETGPNVATILDGEDGAGKVSSVNGKDGAVTLAAGDVGAYTTAETDAKVTEATSRTWEATVQAAAWVPAEMTWAGITAHWSATVQAEGVTADTEIDIIKYTGGDRPSYEAVPFVDTDAGTITLYAVTKPTAEFSVEFTEVR